MERRTQMPSAKLIRRFWPYMRKYKKTIALDLLSTLESNFGK